MVHGILQFAPRIAFCCALYRCESQDIHYGLLAASQAANHPRHSDLNTSPDHSIVRSDGRCVQRAGT
ncbi:hypothetical protein KSP40_PGU016277 [Platanthera guangdongensis]|uniref:Secreted protein n=1 Tax=Platanthera guangdongensis TaxID=2320717 RepID=A0ABR2LZ82_9ASPA